MLEGARSVRTIAALALCGTAGALGAGVAAGGRDTAGTAQLGAKTTIVITAGKPAELSFTLSKRTAIPAGNVVFDVTNKGSQAHSVRICARPSATATANTCSGHGTPVLAPGKNAVLAVHLATGKYEYLSTVPGQAAAGMKGLITVTAPATAPKPSAPATTTVPAAPAPTTTVPPVTATPPPTTPAPADGGGNGNPPCMIDGTPC